MTPALDMEAVRKVYRSGGEDVVALDHADLVVGSDEILALVGPSGSGKTTLCSIAGGILAPTSGRVVVGGVRTVETAQVARPALNHQGLVDQAAHPSARPAAAAHCPAAVVVVVVMPGTWVRGCWSAARGGVTV